MTEQQDARHLLERAERAATAGDLVSADELLRGAARIQEEELGPHHPDLANTLNNLAIVAERTGSSSEAETLLSPGGCHRGGGASVRPSDDRGKPAEPRRLLPRAWLVNRRTRRHATPAQREPRTPPSPPRPNWRQRRLLLRPLPPAPTPGRASHLLEWVATGAVVLVAAVLLLLRPWSSRDASSPAPPPGPAAAQPAEACRRELRHRPPGLPRSNSRRHRRPRLLAMIETSPRTRRPRQAASPWPPRSYAAPSRRVAATGAAIRWATPRRRDRWFSTHASGLRAIPQWCIAGITEARCGNP